MLELADPHLRYRGTRSEQHPDGLYRLSECYRDMAAMSMLKDSVLDLIEADPRPELEPARDLLRRVAKRDLVSLTLHIVRAVKRLLSISVYIAKLTSLADRRSTTVLARRASPEVASSTR